MRAAEIAEESQRQLIAHAARKFFMSRKKVNVHVCSWPSVRTAVKIRSYAHNISIAMRHTRVSRLGFIQDASLSASGMRGAAQAIDSSLHPFKLFCKDASDGVGCMFFNSSTWQTNSFSRRWASCSGAGGCRSRRRSYAIAIGDVQRQRVHDHKLEFDPVGLKCPKRKFNSGRAQSNHDEVSLSVLYASQKDAHDSR